MPSKCKILFFLNCLLVAQFLSAPPTHYFSLLSSRYMYGQPVPGQVLVEVCREPVYTLIAVPGLTRQCLTETARVCDYTVALENSFFCLNLT